MIAGEREYAKGRRAAVHWLTPRGAALSRRALPAHTDDEVKHPHRGRRPFDCLYSGFCAMIWTRAAPPPGRRPTLRTNPFRQLAFGIERIGLVPLRFPLIVALLTVALSITAGFGIARTKVDDSLSQLFRSETPDFKRYEEVSRRFPSSEFDVLVVVEGKALLERASLEKLRELVTELQLIDGTRGLISLFSARQPPEGGHLPEALFPKDLPTGAAYDELIARVRGNDVIRGKLLSEDGEL